LDVSFERFCLRAGIEAIEQMLAENARQLCGDPHSRSRGRAGHRGDRRAASWASTAAK
jgi:hypothetical protein